MRAVIFDRIKLAGGKMDFSQIPIYKHHVESMTKAYAREGSPESAIRAFALVCLRQAAGRLTEQAQITLDGSRYDSFFKCVFGEWPQPKVTKDKSVAFVAGANRGLCFFTTWADHMLFTCFSRLFTLLTF